MLIVVTPPAMEPVSLALAKLQIRRDDITTDDPLIQEIIGAAREYTEGIQDCAYITRQYSYLTIAKERMPFVADTGVNQYFGNFPFDASLFGFWLLAGQHRGIHINLPFPPVISVDSVIITDHWNHQTVVTDWRLDNDRQISRLIVPNREQSTDYVAHPRDITIVYTAGMSSVATGAALTALYAAGNAPGSNMVLALEKQLLACVPRAAKQAMLLLIGHWYENRELIVMGRDVVLPHAVDALLQLDRRGWGAL